MRLLTILTILMGFALAMAQDTTSPNPAPVGEAVQPVAEPAPEPAAEPTPAPAAEPAADAAAPVADEGEKAPEGGKDGEPDKGAGSKDKVQWTVGLGSVTVDGKQWNRLSLRPDIPIGKFGICLDIEIFVDDSGNISSKGWKFDDAKSSFESIQRKIYYLRWGHPGDKLYAKVGALDGVNLGYGLIMSGYSNSQQYPDIKKMGLHFELNDISSMGVGLQAMVNNFQDFQNGGALYGTRLSVQPLKTTGIPLLKKLIVGGSFVNDMNQQAVIRDRDKDSVPDVLDKRPDDVKWAIDHPNFVADIKDTAGLTAVINTMDSVYQVKNRDQVDLYKPYIGEKDPFGMVGADLGLPVLSTKLMDLLFYGQWAMNMDKTGSFDTEKTKGWGLAAPGAQFRIGPVTLNAEYRYFVDQFQGGYFDQTYELDRVFQSGENLLTKEQKLIPFDSTTRKGVFSKASLNIFNLLMADASYQWLTVTDNHKVASPDVPGSDQSFKASAGFGETIRKILNKVKIDDITAYYLKTNIGSTPVGIDSVTGDIIYDKFLETTNNILFGYKIGVQLSSSMVLNWDNQYYYVTGDSPFDFKRLKRVNIETVMKF